MNPPSVFAGWWVLASAFVRMLTGAGALLGAPAAGYAFNLLGSYTGAILAGAALCLVSFVITLLTPEPARWLAARKSRP